MIVFGILLIVCGVFMLWQPATTWAITERWKSLDATAPSSLYLWSTRFGGLMCTGVGLALLIVRFLWP